MDENERNEEVNPDIVSMTQENFEEHLKTKILPGVLVQIKEAAEAGKIKSIKEEHRIRRVKKEDSEDGVEHLVTHPSKFIIIEIVTGEQEREKVNPEGMDEVGKHCKEEIR